jgi:hypothetical protein
VLLTGPQRKTIGTFVPYLFHPLDETKLPVARVVVCDTILFLNIIIIMPASQNRSNCAFRCGLLHLATMPTAKSGFNFHVENIFLINSDETGVNLHQNLGKVWRKKGHKTPCIDQEAAPATT